jgi:hypothetical protein
MSITLLYGCFQVETGVRDLDVARALMYDALGGRPIEQKLAHEIAALVPGGDYRVDHIDLGRATFQVNQPSSTVGYAGRKSVHQDYLERVGPSVTNLNYYVDDIAHARALLTEMGAQTRAEGPSTAAASLADYGPNNTRAGGDTRPFLFMGARHLIGFDLEIMEPNFLRFNEQTAQWPCFLRPDSYAEPELVLQRLRVVVDDLEATYANLVALFTPGSRSNPYDVREGSRGRAFRVTLGGIEVEYCQPSSPSTPLAQHLDEHGAGVTVIQFAAADAGAVVDGVRKVTGLPMSEEVDLLGDPTWIPGWQVASRDVVGFDVVLLGSEVGQGLASSLR